MEPLFPSWIAGPNGPQPAVWAWRAYTNPTQSITSSVANPRPLSDIPSGILAMVWYSSAPGAVPIRKTFEYGDARPFTFYMPDGTTRTNASNMAAPAYQQLVDNLWALNSYPA